MLNPIKRVFKPQVQVRSVNLGIAEEPVTPPSAECEVIEYDSVTGWEQWKDSVFMQDFEDSILTAPAPLSLDGVPANQDPFDMVDPFAHIGKNSA